MSSKTLVETSDSLGELILRRLDFGGDRVAFVSLRYWNSIKCNEIILLLLDSHLMGF
jgi:hypothetical protein